MRTVAVIGAGGSVGAKTCRAALEDGLNVVAIDRAFDGADWQSAIEYRTADVLSDDLTGVLSECDAVISTLGLPFSPENIHQPSPLYSTGTVAIIDAMRRHGLRRLAVISAAFVVPQRSLPLWFAFTVVPALHAILEEMRAMERIVRASGLDWTIARPGWLLDQPAQDTLMVADEMLPAGAFRCREADLARFLVDTVSGDRWIEQRPAMGAPDRSINESPLAIGRALAVLAPGICRCLAGTRG